MLLLYYIYWAGYKVTTKEYSWLNTLELDHTKKIIQDFHTQYPDKPGPILASLFTYGNEVLCLNT